METSSWTELFFLDEATALAAGHCPCFHCRRPDAELFRAAWTAGNGGGTPRASEIDQILHQERLLSSGKRLHPLSGPISELPDGAMIASKGESYLVRGSDVLRWSPSGYKAEEKPTGVVSLLTPPSTLRAIAAGYRPKLHPT
jgi:hypothetical protein